MNNNIFVFSYGTLRYAHVQRKLLGREPDMWPDSLVRYKLTSITIADEKVVAISNQKTHPIIHFTDNAQNVVEGMCVQVTESELHQLDQYETDDYQRVEVKLVSGKNAFAYVSANDSQMPLYQFQIINKNVAQRRRFMENVQPVEVTIPDFRLKENSYCNMIVLFADDTQKEYLARVVRNSITGEWKVDGTHVTVKVIIQED